MYSIQITTFMEEKVLKFHDSKLFIDLPDIFMKF